MKKIALPLLAAALALCAGAPRASLTTTMQVTTFDDENGTNRSACSLREAVQAVSSRKAFGGCPAGNAFTNNLIQLEAGTYNLPLGELYVTGEVIIGGADSEQEAHDLIEDPLTGVKPRQFRPDFEQAAPIGKTGTYIVARPGSRILNNSAAATLQQLVLVGSASPLQASPASVADNGGVIFSSSALALRNVIIRGGSVTGSTVASGNGGAIYLAGDGPPLTLIDTTIEDSHATRSGGAVAMLCSAGLNPHAVHALSISRSLFRGNTAADGAGAVDICGNTTATISASTFSANSSGASSGALAYVQGSEVNLGSLTLTNVTAAEQEGHVLALNGVGSVTITSSLLAHFNDTVGGAAVCHNPDPLINWSANTVPSGTYNAYTDDGSCDNLMVTSSGHNVLLPTGAARSSVLHAVTSPAYPVATAVGAPYALTDYYLPIVGSPVLDVGPDFDSCQATDQRNVPRRSGTACDIGAVERLQLTPRDDLGESVADTDRLAIIDVLANDSFGESEVTGPFKFAANTPDDPDTPLVNEYSPAVILVDDADGRCKWMLSDDPDYPGMLVVQSLDQDWLDAATPQEVPDGALTTEEEPITCTYRVVDSSATSLAEGKVEVLIRNQAPNALNDSYVRPVGETGVVFNPLENDNDEGDGKFGLLKHTTPNPTPALPDLVTYGPEVGWAPFFPIEIVEQPSLGRVYGASSGLCPGSTIVPKVCLNPPLRYEANNNLSPFTDTFTYRVYDVEAQSSNSAMVSIHTDAPDPDHGGGAGSLDWLAGIALSLLGLRRFRRL